MVDPSEMVDLEDGLEPGTTAVLTPEGWQTTAYEEPGETWRLLPDGSWESPDGTIRSYPLDAPTGD